MMKNDDVVAAKANSVTCDLMTHIKIPVPTYKKFGEYVQLKYLSNEDAINKNEQNEIEYVFNIGLSQAISSLFTNDSPLLHKGKKPRRDEWERLGRIASEFLKMERYPYIASTSLQTALNKALGNMDVRTIKEYRSTVLHYCNVDELRIARGDTRLGLLDISFFVKLIPRQYICTLEATSSTSSLGEGICSDPAYLGTKNG